MEDRTVIGAFILFSMALLSDQVETDAVSSSTVPTTTTPAPSVMICVNQVQSDYVASANCTNGRGLTGCCVERTYCEYNTSNIDLTMYGRRGYRETCGDKYVCCPSKYVLPVVLNTEPDDDTDFDDDV